LTAVAVAPEPPFRFCACGHELHVGPCLARLPDRCSCLGGREAASSRSAYAGLPAVGRDGKDFLERAIDALLVWSRR